MENLKPLEDKGTQEEKQKVEEQKPMPFGTLGIHFLCNVTQYAVFLGLTVLIIAIIQIFMPE
jgi:hypothetical protein